VGAVIGIGGTVGAIGGALFSKYSGDILDRVGSYAPMFIAAGAAYFLAVLSVHLLTPRLARVESFRRSTPWAVIASVASGIAGVIFFLASGKNVEGCVPVWMGFGSPCFATGTYWAILAVFAAIAILAIVANTVFREKAPQA
jgi:ACS family hexuronate transporter-like MFS transporter